MYSMVNVSPKHPTLSKHILYYYFFSSDDLNFNEKFTHYPHSRTTLNIHLNSDIHISNKNRVITYNPNANIKTVLTNNRACAKDAYLQGKFDIIGVIFNPLGINHFIKENFSSIAPCPVVPFDDYWSDFSEEMEKVFGVSCMDEKAHILDHFFIQHYHPLKESTILKIVQHIIESHGMVQVGELEASFSTSRRTILRLFNKHLGCSISDFKKIIKFRNVLNIYQKKLGKRNLTELSHIANYYDQSDFINHFKSLSGEIPKDVLKKLATVGKQDLYWKFDIKN